MTLNRREILKGTGLGFLGLLFRGRGGKLQEESETPAQQPSAITIKVVPQRAFRPERLMIVGTVIGTRIVPEKKLVTCTACDGQRARDEDDEYDEDAAYCETCGGLGDELVETGRMIEQPVTIVPWTIENITVGARSQLTGPGTIPGDAFNTSAFDNALSFDAAQADQAIEIVAHYTGDKPGGEEFRGALIGTSYNEDGSRQQRVLPLSSGVAIVAERAA